MYEFVLPTNYNAEKRASDVKKVKNRCKQKFEGEAKNMQLDIKEDTRRGNLKGKCVFNILILLFVFIIVKYDFILWYEARAGLETNGSQLATD